MDDAARLGARLIANLRTGRLWGSRPPPSCCSGGSNAARCRTAEAPAADWDVGHFVELERWCEAERVRSSSSGTPTRRSAGTAVTSQPPEVLAQALMRGDGRRGGVLVRRRAGAGAGAPRSSRLRSGWILAIWNNEQEVAASGDRAGADDQR